MSNVDVLVVYRDHEGAWRWRAQGANGEQVAQGESHTRAADARRAARGAFPTAPIKMAAPAVAEDVDTDGQLL